MNTRPGFEQPSTQEGANSTNASMKPVTASVVTNYRQTKTSAPKSIWRSRQERKRHRRGLPSWPPSKRNGLNLNQPNKKRGNV
ncbi:hypothetical protein Leryth_005260 [Lithospermum erythrorhizon]|nr:hypothetical protein Leryth_005260 [Lithospermum erythrorhizon]